jgi:hypothetical protein
MFNRTQKVKTHEGQKLVLMGSNLVFLAPDCLGKLSERSNQLVHIVLGVGERNQPLLIKTRRGDYAAVESP